VVDNFTDNPSQALLERSLSVGNDAKRRAMLLDHMKAVGESLEDTLNKYDIDVIIGPGDCFLSLYSAALGLLSTLTLRIIN
jgi:amidase